MTADAIVRGTERIDLSRYFLPYQIDAIMSDARLELWEKSIRIGATFCYGFRQVRRRMLPGMGDYLHTSVNERIARSFILDCKRFCRVFEAVYKQKVQESAVDEVSVYNPLTDRQESAYQIRFEATRQYIKAYSSNPDALRGEGGEVGIDELTSHRDPEAMLAAAGGRAMWGYPIRIWTSHKGDDSAFNRMIREERAKGKASRWRIRSTSLTEAIDMGLLGKINETRGLSLTREEFIADTIALVGGREAYEEECLLKPRAGGAAAIDWKYIEAAKQPYDILYLEVADPDEETCLRIADELAEHLAGRPGNLGYDVARKGHLAAMMITAKEGDRHRLVGRIILPGTRFPLQRNLARQIMRRNRGMTGLGDATGLGMETCEELERELGEARFKGVNFSGLKPELGTKLIQAYEDGRMIQPEDGKYDDIAWDVHGIRSEHLPSGRLRFYESANPIEKRSHCDMGWALALAVMAGLEDAAPAIYLGAA